MSAAFTPGPWTLETVKTAVGICHKIGPFPGSRLHPVSHACIYEDGLHLAKIPPKETELLANARLIAQAPEAHQLIQRALDILHNQQQEGDRAYFLLPWINEARAYLRTVEGDR